MYLTIEKISRDKRRNKYKPATHFPHSHEIMQLAYSNLNRDLPTSVCSTHNNIHA